jgi:hypothetical protein
MKIDSTPRKNPSVAFRTLSAGEGGVLLHLESGEYHGINDLGCLIWELVDGQRSVAEVVEAVRERVDDAPAEVGADVLGFLDDLQQRNLVSAGEAR